MKQTGVFFLLISALIVSCGHMSKNTVKSGDVIIQGGRFEKDEWSDPLNFKRYSWFQELTLVYDLLIVPDSKLGPFKKWISKDMATEVAKCSHFALALTYHLEDEKFPKSFLSSQIFKKGVKRLSMKKWSQHLRSHPNYTGPSLGLYKVEGICFDQKTTKMSISIPNFGPVDVNL